MASQISPRIIRKIQKNLLFLHLKTAKKNMEIVLYILIGLVRHRHDDLLRDLFHPFPAIWQPRTLARPHRLSRPPRCFAVALDEILGE